MIQKPIDDLGAEGAWALNELGKQVSGSWKNAFDLQHEMTPNAPVGVFVSGCSYHCDMWGLAQVDGKTNTDHHSEWYKQARQWWQEGSKGQGPRLLKIADDKF